MDALGEWKASAGGDPFPYGTPVCDPTFDPSSRAAQQFLYDACAWSRGNATKLSMREQNQYYQSGLCFMEYFAQQARTATGAFPAPPEMFNAVVARTLSAYGYFSRYVGLSEGWPASCGVGTPCRVTFLAVSYHLNVNKLSAALDSQPVYVCTTLLFYVSVFIPPCP